MFPPILNRALVKKHKGPCGRPPYNFIMLFKVVILQRIYNFSDDQTVYQINDRMSFTRFLGLTLGDNVPDSKTIWLFRDTLAKATVMPDLFTLFNQKLEAAHLITYTESVANATFVDIHSKLIAAYSIHDSQESLGLLDDSDAVLYADSAYLGAPISEKLPDNMEKIIQQKGYRNHPLNDTEKESHRLKSKVRIRVEYVFGFMTGSMHGLTLRCIGKMRADFNIGLTNRCTTFTAAKLYVE